MTIMVVSTPMLFLSVLSCYLVVSNGFSLAVPSSPKRTVTTTLSMSKGKKKGWQDWVKEAFENDTTLSREDLVDGQLEDERARQRRLQMEQLFPSLRNTEPEATTPSDDLLQRLEGTTWNIPLYLVGIPNKDPSNDLYGPRVSISTRDKKRGMNVPAEPTVTVALELLPNGECRVSETPFCEGKKLGGWKVTMKKGSPVLQFSIEALGYKRTIQTKGTIERVYWSQQPETKSQTSTMYSIPPGWVFGEVGIGEYGGLYFEGEGVLYVQKRQGLFGATTTLVPCGKFIGETVITRPETKTREEEEEEQESDSSNTEEQTATYAPAASRTRKTEDDASNQHPSMNT
eukprot:CAMPEP_0116837004 /NCGR_PEP_ID=MMETSP0418-20121206/8416_1 /TAXON_ID=1158023 /ORGANISM="Astrosyne radiata, Strain 13vi08-1A" /LENGTH=343 /DNA_ID=CAMNT_0004466847 /DNA_START=48 /DNA_END=1079 /DNA_ORIENTATION=+